MESVWRNGSIDKIRHGGIMMILDRLPVCPPVSFGPGGFLYLGVQWKKKNITPIDNC